MQQSAVSRIEQADYSGWTFRTLLKVAFTLNARLRVSFEPLEDVIATAKRSEESAAVQLATVSDTTAENTGDCEEDTTEFEGTKVITEQIPVDWTRNDQSEVYH
jgi:hypothetical protein